MSDLRVGVVGVGQRAVLARQVNRPHSGASVVACCDPAPRGQVTARELFGPDVPVVESHLDLLSMDLHAAMVLTPDDTHAAVATDLLAAGVAVFVEKPLAIDVAGCDHILQVAKDHQCRLYVGHNMRHLPVVRAMRQLISQGAVGSVKAIWCRHFIGHGGDYYFKDWHADRSRTNSLLLHKGAHDLDVIHWLGGGFSRTVVALGGLAVYGASSDRRSRDGERVLDWFNPATNWPPLSLTGLSPIIDVEDVSMMLTSLDNGVYASYQQCHFTPDYWRNYTVIGDAGRLENFGDAEGATIKVWNSRSAYRDVPDHLHSVSGTGEGHADADALLVDEFLRFVRDGGPTETSPTAAREAVATGCAATESLRNGGAPRDVQPIDPVVAAYFDQGQPGALNARCDPGR